jgi:hypothetical protein
MVVDNYFGSCQLMAAFFTSATASMGAAAMTTGTFTTTSTSATTMPATASAYEGHNYDSSYDNGGNRIMPQEIEEAGYEKNCAR